MKMIAGDMLWKQRHEIYTIGDATLRPQKRDGGLRPLKEERTMRVTLYDHSYETFAIQYLAATLKQHTIPVEVFYDCSMDKDYLDQDLLFANFFSLSAESLAERILKTNPDIVGFSIITVFYPIIRRIIHALKERKPSLIIVTGGPHCICATDEILKNDEVDFVLLGDAEVSLPNLVRKLGEHSVDSLKVAPKEMLPGVANRHADTVVHRGFGPLIEDLDAVPYPEKKTYYKKNPSLKKVYTTICSRGCLFNCTYCNSPTLKTEYNKYDQKYYRVSSVDRVIQELLYAKKEFKPKYIMFIDNLFAPNEAWLEEFAERYSTEIGLPFFCETNPNVHTVRTLDLLAKAGCQLLQFGFQSTHEVTRKQILNRSESNEKITELVTHAKKKGMFVCIDHIADLPGEIKDHCEEAVQFYQKLRPDWINLGFLQYYPGAAIVDISIAHKMMQPADLAAVYRGEMQSSFRLLSKSHLSAYYRTLPMRFLIAIKAPRPLSRVLLACLDNDVIMKIVSPIGSYFIYASRVFFAFTDSRDFLVRHHILRNLYVLKILFCEKVFGCGR